LEALQVVSANALLKTLEEPPQSTIFLLVSSRIDKILPTIKSRCRLISMPRPTEEMALNWMTAELNSSGIVADGIDLSSTLKEAGGAVLPAFLQITSPSERGADAEMKQFLLENLAKGRDVNWLGTSEKVFKLPMPDLLITLERWVSDLLSYQMAQTHYFFPKYQSKVADCARSANTSKLTQYWKRLVEARRYELHPLSSKLQLEALLIDYREIFKS
jgi:DNA polymerase-3 subunit delta'